MRCYKKRSKSYWLSNERLFATCDKLFIFICYYDTMILWNKNFLTVYFILGEFICVIRS